jgi:hypothetical protein
MPVRTPPNLAQYNPQTILDAAQCAEWLGISVDSLERSDIPIAYLGERTKRYLVGAVIAHLERQMKRAA